MTAALACLLLGLTAILIALTERRLRSDALRPVGPGEGTAPLSVVVALRDEATRAPALLRSLLAQDHPDLEVVIVDDRSTDATRDAVVTVVAGDPRVRVLRVDELPAGWQGRLWAQDVGVAAATREWLLFLSGDQRLVTPDLLRRIVVHAAVQPTGALAVIGRFAGASFWDRWWLRPILNSTVVVGSILLLQAWIGTTWLVGALAMRRAVYAEVGGAEAARSCGGGLFEDLGWSRAFADQRRPARTFYDASLCDVSNWEGPREILDGLARWVAGVFTYRAHGWLLGGVLIASLSAAIAGSFGAGLDLVAGRMPSIAELGSAALFPLLGLSYCRRDDRSRLVALAFYPIAVLALAALVAGLVARVRNRVVWRGERLRLQTRE